MILMALDHTRDFFGAAGDNPTDLSRASSALFLTRWITHFCAPVFFVLTGVGLAQTGTIAPMFESADLAHYPVSFPPGWGFGLPIVYGVWLVVVAVSYAPCRWFAEVKNRRNARILSYL